MSATVKASTRLPGSLKERYREAMLKYVMGGGEQSLGLAYELGREAMHKGVGLLEFTAIHQLVVRELSTARVTPQRVSILCAAADFLAESLSPYEMAQRGFRDAIIAARQLNETLEKEIKRIAYSVHDEASQLLAAVHIALDEALRDQLQHQKGKLKFIKQLLGEIEGQLRRYSHELRPTVLDDLGLLPAIRFLASNFSRKTEISILVQGDHPGRLPEAMEIGLYRVVQEALANATKHARASRILIDVRAKSGTLKVSITDNGIGFDSKAHRGVSEGRGLGLLSMKERLTAIGGTLSISSAHMSGTKLSISLPIPGEVTFVDSSASGG